MCSYAIGFGDRTGPGLSGVTNTAYGGYPGVNGGTSTNNPFLGTRFFAMKDLPWNQYNLWYFQWTVRTRRVQGVRGYIISLHCSRQ